MPHSRKFTLLIWNHTFCMPEWHSPYLHSVLLPNICLQWMGLSPSRSIPLPTHTNIHLCVFSSKHISLPSQHAMETYRTLKISSYWYNRPRLPLSIFMDISHCFQLRLSSQSLEIGDWKDMRNVKIVSLTRNPTKAGTRSDWSSAISLTS